MRVWDGRLAVVNCDNGKNTTVPVDYIWMEMARRWLVHCNCLGRVQTHRKHSGIHTASLAQITRDGGWLEYINSGLWLSSVYHAYLTNYKYNCYDICY